MRFRLLMLAAYLGAVACQKDQSPSHGTSSVTGDVAASTSSQSAAVTTAASNAASGAQGAAPTHPGAPQLRGQSDQPVDDEAMSATDKSGVDNPETDEDDSKGADDAEEE